MSSIGENELQEIYAFAIQLGKDAGNLLLDAANLRMQGDGREEQTSVEKASSVDLVTQTDEGKFDIVISVY
jgi:myo-inositol-1(or 4)-monophosphatase